VPRDLCPQVLVETFEDGAHVTRYVEQGPGAPHNSALAQLGSGAMLQVCVLPGQDWSELHVALWSKSGTEQQCSGLQTGLAQCCH